MTVFSFSFYIMFALTKALHHIICEPQIKFCQHKPDTFIHFGPGECQTQNEFQPKYSNGNGNDKKILISLEYGKKKCNVQTLLHTNFICHHISL